MREGDLLKLKCSSLGGYPLPMIKWIKHIHETGDEKEISGLETKSGYSGVSSELYVRLTGSDNGATYKCLVSNEAIAHPLSASVVLHPVYFASEHLKAKPVEGVRVKADDESDSDASFACESGECYPLCNISWYRDGFKLSPGANALGQYEEKSSHSPGEHGGQTTVSRLTVRQKWSSKEDGNSFTCVASNNFLPNKRASKNITVHVLCKLPADTRIRRCGARMRTRLNCGRRPL